MAVMPESMNKLDTNDTPGSLSRIESYIRYMRERIEFAMSNMGRNVGEAGTSSVNVLITLQELDKAISQLSSAVNSMVGTLNSTNKRIDEMQESITSIQEEVTALGERVAALE